MTDIEESEDTAEDIATSVVGDRILRCPRCKVRAHQIWGRVKIAPPERDYEEFFDEATKDQPATFSMGLSHREPSVWFGAHCQGCDQKTLWRDDVCVFPLTSSAPAPHEQMPTEVKSLYEEAGRVLPISRRAGAALVRAALEKLIKILDPEAPQRAPLDERIARLSSRVSTPLGELLDVVRFVGNASLHGSGDEELVYLYLDNSDGTDDISEMLFDAINDLVDELVARPASTKTLWDKLPAGVKKSIEQKRLAQT